MPLATLYQWLLLLHIVAAMIWVGGTVTLSALATYVVRRRDRDATARFVASLPVIGPVVMAPAVLAVLGFGIWLVVDSDAWSFDQTWIWIALAVFAAAFVVGAAFQSRAAIGAQRAVDEGDDDAAAAGLAHWAWGSRVIVALLLVAAWDMVFKPAL